MAVQRRLGGEHAGKALAFAQAGEQAFEHHARGRIGLLFQQRFQAFDDAQARIQQRQQLLAEQDDGELAATRALQATAASRLDRADMQAAHFNLAARVGFVECVDDDAGDRQVGREGAYCKLHEDLPG